MAQDDPRQRLEAATKKRDELQRTVARVEGRLTAAREDLGKVETECRLRKLEPHQLDQAIEKLRGRLDTEVADLESRIKKAEGAVAPFLKETA